MMEAGCDWMHMGKSSSQMKHIVNVSADTVCQLRSWLAAKSSASQLYSVTLTSSPLHCSQTVKDPKRKGISLTRADVMDG